MKTQYKSCDSLSGSEDQLLNTTKKLDVATNTCQSLDKDVLVQNVSFMYIRGQSQWIKYEYKQYYQLKV